MLASTLLEGIGAVVGAAGGCTYHHVSRRVDIEVQCLYGGGMCDSNFLLVYTTISKVTAYPYSSPTQPSLPPNPPSQSPDPPH